MREEAEARSVFRVLGCLEDLKPREIETFFRDNHLKLLSESNLWENMFSLISWNTSKQKFVHKFTKDDLISKIRNSISHFNYARSPYSINDKLTAISPLYQSPIRKNSATKNSAFMCFDARRKNSNKFDCSILGGCLKRESPFNDCSTKSNSQLTIRDPISHSLKVSEFNEFSSFMADDTKKSDHESLNYCYLTKKRNKDKFLNDSEMLESRITFKPDSTSIGLKDITRKVIEILKICQITTYKDLSKQILEQLPIETDNESKNIRRRIYDAINVLKAINCLKQDNSKHISLNHHEFDEKLEMQDEIIRKGIERQISINDKKEELKEKQHFLNYLMKKLVLSNQLSHNTDNSSDLRLFFPFIIAYTQPKESSSTTILSSEMRKKLFVSSDKPIILKGDYDLMCMLNKISTD